MTAGRLPRRARSISFKDYVLTRRYHFGRGSSEAWMFTARALGEPHLLGVESWLELRGHLEQAGSDASTIRAAQTVWTSYLAHVAKNRSSNAFEHPSSARGKSGHGLQRSEIGRQRDGYAE